MGKLFQTCSLKVETPIKTYLGTSLMYFIVVYIPKTHLNEVKTAMFNAGAGKIGMYDSCSWETEGLGQFRPLAGSSPFLGSKDHIEQVKEIKVEMVCKKEDVKAILKALLATHPYEEPAYHAVEILTLNDFIT